MIPRSAEPPADAFAFARMGDTLVPAIPRTLREHVGNRTFGDFGSVLLAQTRPTDDLSARVQRWRGLDTTGQPVVRASDYANAKLQPHPDQMFDGRRLRRGLKVTTLLLTSWIAFGIGVAIATGRI